MLALISILLMAACAFAVAICAMDRRDMQRSRDQIESRMGTGSHDGRSNSKYKLPVLARRLSGHRENRNVDKDLPELIDVLGLGMRSGLSFENAFSIYANRFDSPLARECRAASALMTSGVMPREEAMNELASRLCSRSFSRFVRITLRSARFGSSLLPMLESLSEEVRREYRNSIEEKAAKAPTKMLVPTGALILPAMMLMVCGPFLLELMEQF